MTNKELWDSYTSGLASPQIFLDWSWYYTIGAALERRVWMPPAHAPVFANKYVMLVGKSGLGKGGGIRAATHLLSEHKQEQYAKDISKLTPEQQAVFKEIERREKEKAQEVHDAVATKNGSLDKAHLFPRAADSTTYESLVRCLVQSIRKQSIIKINGEGKPMVDYESSCSMYFSLEELASLMRKHTNDLTNFLIQCYDCSDTYEYITKTQGRDRILRVCLNFLAGTTPHFLSSVFDTSIIDEGFSSRTFFVFAAKDRKTVFSIPQLTPEQVQSRIALSKHVKGLKDLYGEVRIDSDTFTKLEGWFNSIRNEPSKRASRSDKLDPYYNRGNLHAMKTAMAMHFGESYEKYIPWSVFEQVIDEVLPRVEKTMHMALMMNEENPMAKTAARMIQFLHLHGKRTFKQLWAEFFKYSGGDKRNIEEIITFLIETDQVVKEKIENLVTKEVEIWYKLKER